MDGVLSATLNRLVFLVQRNKGSVRDLERQAQEQWGNDFSGGAGASDGEKADIVDQEGLEKLTIHARKFAAAIKDLHSAFPVTDPDGKTRVRVMCLLGV